MRCHHPELFPLLAEVPETKTETVSTKLSELPQITTYHTITYQAHTGALPPPSDRSPKLTVWDLVPYIGPETEADIGPKSEADWDLVPYIEPKSEADIGPKSEADWDLVPYIEPKSEADIGPKSEAD